MSRSIKVAEQLWTHGFAAGPKGRFAPYLPFFWTIWVFSKNKDAAKSLLVHLSQPSSIEKLVVASGGYDLPAYERLMSLKVWAEAEPPKGTLYHYPNPYNHQKLSIAASPAPPKIAQQIGDTVQDGAAPRSRRANGEDPGLGRRRVRRLHAERKLA